MRRCLILGCSETKTETPGKVSAIERYDGPSFRVLRRFLADVPPADPRRELDVFVLSAEFGLIEGKRKIPVYDRRMTHKRAADLQKSVLDAFKTKIASQVYTELFLLMSKTYLTAMAGYKKILPPTTRVIIAEGGSGRKLTALKAWLIGDTEQAKQLSLPLATPEDNGRTASSVRGQATIKGVELALTPNQIYEQARQALVDEVGKPYNFRDWYVLVDGVRVGPKWLVSQLAQIPVSHFDASAARRVLASLGVPVHRSE